MVSLLDAAGIEVRGEMQGQSILPLRNNRRANGAPDSKAANAPVSPRYGEEFLYDLGHAQYELRNLVDNEKYADVRAELRETLSALIIEAGETPPQIETASTENSP